VRGRVIRKTNALREEGPVEVFSGRQEFHTAIPKSPPAFNFAVALRVVPAGGGVLGASCVKDSSKESGQELGRGVRVDEVR
jgi:hypothetical protein